MFVPASPAASSPTHFRVKVRRPGRALEVGAAAASEFLEIILLQNATLVKEGPERTASALFSWPPRADFRHSPCEDPEAFAMTTMVEQVQAGLGD